MRLVVVESPYGNADEKIVERNIAYAVAAAKDCLRRQESPFLSHLYLPRILADGDPVQRQLGIKAGLAWAEKAEATVVYTDYGISLGMAIGIERAERAGRLVEYRKILGDDV